MRETDLITQHYRQHYFGEISDMLFAFVFEDLATTLEGLLEEMPKRITLDNEKVPDLLEDMKCVIPDLQAIYAFHQDYSENDLLLVDEKDYKSAREIERIRDINIKTYLNKYGHYPSNREYLEWLLSVENDLKEV